MRGPEIVWCINKCRHIFFFFFFDTSLVYFLCFAYFWYTLFYCFIEICANHVGKWMKTRLLKLASTYAHSTTYISGRRRVKLGRRPLRKILTERKVNQLSNYYISVIHSWLLVQVPESCGSRQGPDHSCPGAGDILHLSP